MLIIILIFLIYPLGLTIVNFGSLFIERNQSNDSLIDLTEKQIFIAGPVFTFLLLILMNSSINYYSNYLLAIGAASLIIIFVLWQKTICKKTLYMIIIALASLWILIIWNCVVINYGYIDYLGLGIDNLVLFMYASLFAYNMCFIAFRRIKEQNEIEEIVNEMKMDIMHKGQESL